MSRPACPLKSGTAPLIFSRPVPAYFQLLERRVLSLMGIGVQADVILFHHYDFGRWGIDEAMTDPDALQYVSYLMARLGAFRNVWWSLANEYDIAKLPNGDGALPISASWIGTGSVNLFKGTIPMGIFAPYITAGLFIPTGIGLLMFPISTPGTYSLLMALKNTYQKPVVNDEYQYEEM